MVDWSKPIEIVFGAGDTREVTHLHEFNGYYFVWIKDYPTPFSFSPDGKSKYFGLIVNKQSYKTVYLYRGKTTGYIFPGVYKYSSAELLSQGLEIIGEHVFPIPG